MTAQDDYGADDPIARYRYRIHRAMNEAHEAGLTRNDLIAPLCMGVAIALADKDPRDREGDLDDIRARIRDMISIIGAKTKDGE